jgi:hypothetical protein
VQAINTVEGKYAEAGHGKKMREHCFATEVILHEKGSGLQHGSSRRERQKGGMQWRSLLFLFGRMPGQVPP